MTTPDPAATLYRVHTDPFLTGSQLFAAKFCQHPAAKPEHPEFFDGEWYCFREDCVVREVEIHVKLHGEPMPKLTCPACRGPLEFHHYFAHETLVPVEDSR